MLKVVCHEIYLCFDISDLIMCNLSNMTLLLAQKEENKEDLNLPSEAKSSRLREGSLCLSPYQITAKHDSPSAVGVESSKRVHPSAETDRKTQEKATGGENSEDKQFDKGTPSQKSSKGIAGISELPKISSVKQSNQEYKEKNENEVTMFEKNPLYKKDTQDDRKGIFSSSDNITDIGDKGEDMEVTENPNSLTQKTTRNTEREKSEVTAVQKVQEAEEAREKSFLMECDDFEGTITRSKEKIRKEARKAEDSPKEPSKT